MTPRRYVSSVRAAAAEKKRAEVVQAARDLLGAGGGAGAFSLEAAARQAGVTRLTVYNQFGSRRGLLEAVFDDCARRAGLERIREAMATADALAGLDRLVEIFCDFWSDAAVIALQDAALLDAELNQALEARGERRRRAVATLADRIALGAGAEARRDAVDLVFGLTGAGMFRTLRQGRSPQATAEILKSACRRAMVGLIPAGG